MTGKVNVAEINQALVGFDTLVRFDLSSDHIDHQWDLIMSLTNKAGRRLTLLCRDVQNLELNPTGDRFDRMIRLAVEDLRSDALGRVQFALEEQENETLFLHCNDLALQDYA